MPGGLSFPLTCVAAFVFLDWMFYVQPSFHKKLRLMFILSLSLTNIRVSYVGGPLAFSVYAWHRQTDRDIANRHAYAELHPK